MFTFNLVLLYFNHKQMALQLYNYIRLNMYKYYMFMIFMIINVNCNI